MKTTLLLFTALAALCLPACTTDDSATRNTTVGSGSVAGPSSGWSSGTGGFGNVSRDSGSAIRGGGAGAGTSGATGVGWIDNTTGKPVR